MSKKILDGEWNGLERGSDSWYHAQAEGLRNVQLDSVDVKGILELFDSMSDQNLNKASEYAGNMLECLFKIKFCTSQDEDRITGWGLIASMYKNKLFGMIGSGENKDLLTVYRDEIKHRMLIVAEKKYLSDSVYDTDLRAGIEKLPKYNPLEPEDLLRMTEDELLKKIGMPRFKEKWREVIYNNDRYKKFTVLNKPEKFCDVFRDKDLPYVQLHSLELCNDDSDVVGFCGVCKWIGGEISPIDGDSYTKNMLIYGYSWFKDKDGADCIDILVGADW